jgi:predicted metalloprotease
MQILWKFYPLRKRSRVYEEKKQTGYILGESLLLHPEIIKMEGKVIRLEKCSTNKERDWSKDHLCV